MKVILLEELKGKGGEGDVIDVARGFAVNYLLPRKLAVEATAGNLKQLEARRTNIAKREETRRAQAQGLAASLEGKTVVVEAKAGDEGRLFGSVTAQMIVDAIRDQLGVDVDRKKTDVHGHIKELGVHPVHVQVHREVKAEVNVNVVRLGEAEAAKAAPSQPAAALEPGEAPSDVESTVVPQTEEGLAEAARAAAEEPAEETPETDETAEEAPEAE